MRAGAASSSRIVIATGGMSRRDDAERSDREIVHISRVGIDGDRLGENPTERHVHGAEHIGPQDRFVERIARGDGTSTPASRPVTSSNVTRAPLAYPTE